MFASPLKTFFYTATVLACLFIANIAALGADEQPGTITFCKSVTHDGKAIEPSANFSTSTVAMVALFAEPCKTTKILFTIYQTESKLQKMVFREEMQVDPSWNCVLNEGIPFPGTGIYTLSFMRPDGTILASGDVNIITEQPAQPMPAKMEMEGRTLPELFNHFKSQADKK